MVALSGQPNDMRAVRKAAAAGGAGALLALEVFTTVRASVQGMLHNGTRNGQADRTVVPSEDTRPGVGREGRG